MIHNSIGNQRLIHHHIAHKNDLSAEAVVTWMGAMQAQEYKQALWGIGARMQSATLADVEMAIANREIVRTWSQRGTIHFIPAPDTLWMLQLCASRIVAGHGRRMKQLELTEAIIKQGEKLVINALQGQKIMTRAELFALFEDAGISTAGQRGYHIVWHLAHVGVICMGPMRNKEQTFVLLHDWVLNLRQLSSEEALTELVWRYFASHAPATEHDFARWSGLNLTDTRRGIENNRHRLHPVQINTTTYWVADVSSDKPSQRVYLLPAFDEYLLGYQDRSAVLDEEHSQKVVPGNNGVFQPIIVYDGAVVGTWRHKLTKKTVDITLHPFTSLDDIQTDISVAIKSFADFIGLEYRIVSA